MSSALLLVVAPVLAYAQQPVTSPSNAPRVDNGTIANGTYTNECLGFSYSIPTGWEVAGTTQEGKAEQASGGGLVLLVLDQHKGRPFRNRIVLIALDATGFTVDTKGFVSKLVRMLINKGEGSELIGDTLPADFGGKHFFRADYRESFSGGALYKAFVATKFRGYFLGWTLVAGSPEELEESASLLHRISFREDHRNSQCVAGGADAPVSTGVVGGVISSAPNMPQSDPGRPLHVRVSQRVSQALLIKKVQPQYPEAARQERIQGSVVLKALIDTNGDVEELTLVSGHPLLAPAALDAVKHWKYKPYLLQGQPVKVETQITVAFQLQTN